MIRVAAAQAGGVCVYINKRARARARARARVCIYIYMYWMRPMTPSPRRCPRAQHGGPCSAIGANASSKSRRRSLNGALVAALTQLPPARFHLRQPVLHVGEQTAKSHCASVERCSSPVTPSPPGSLLQISKQTLSPPSPFVAIPAQLVLVHL